MRAYLARAGCASSVSEVSADVLEIAREIYVMALDAVRPTAVISNYGWSEIAAELLPGELRGCAEYSVMLFSLGREIDEIIDRYFAAGDPLRALLLDSWGSESVEALARNADRGLRNLNGNGTIRFAPGYSGFDIRKNADWLSLIRGRGSDILDVEVNADTGVILPRKSIICMIGWENQIERGTL
jgi:hypothetical protein